MNSKICAIALGLTSVFAWAGCTGEPGPRGTSGEDGIDGTDGTNGTDGTDGTNGQPCWDLDNDGIRDLPEEDANADGIVDIIDCAGPTDIPLEPDGVVGEVRDAAGDLLAGGVIYFVPTEDVAALPPTTVAVDSPDDEPLEDTIAAHGAASYQQAVIDSDGRYALPDLSPGTYFVTFIPDAGDPAHLPGGSVCRTALAADDLRGTRLDLRVSNAAPADAYYVGSGVCVSCHGRIHISETMHRIGIWSYRESGLLQNFEPRFDELYMAFEQKFAAPGGTTIYYHGYDPSRGFDKYKTSETDPGADVAFTVTVRRNAGNGDLEMLLHNAQNPADPDRVYPVDLIYGGGIKKQRYMTRLSNAYGSFHALLPVQFQHDGSESPIYGRTSKVWRDYHGQKWYDEDNDVFKTPGPKDSFEKNCISCHAVGARVQGSDDTIWQASLVEDRFYASGDVDLDRDGVAEEIDVGCETCHGPGSRHWEAAGQGAHIVSPSLLTPERESVICGQCHSRPKGAFGTDSPVDSAGTMMIAGTSRNEFLSRYATTQLDGAPGDYHGDPDRHSKSHHQQYSDFIRSSLYKNGTELMTCASCHDPHRRTAHPRQLREDPYDNVASCGGCHPAEATDQAAHLAANDIPLAQSTADIALCTDCHMPKTAKSGAGQPALFLQSVQYWQNDITSHLFKFPDRSLARTQGMSVPYTNPCGDCHISAP